MTINWMVIGVLFCIGLPGVFIAMPRVIKFLLASNTHELQGRFSSIAIIQALVMLFVMCVTGEVLSQRTGLQDPTLLALIQGTAPFKTIGAIALPALGAALLSLVLFAVLYYGLVVRILDKQSLECMQNLRKALGVWGCVQYGGITEEIIARWGLMSLTVFFMLLFVNASHWVMWISIFASGIIFAVGLIPAYIAAGCISSRRFIYCLILLSLSQSIVFGYVFWQYGIICAIFAHMLFHLAWGLYEELQPNC